MKLITKEEMYLFYSVNPNTSRRLLFEFVLTNVFDAQNLHLNFKIMIKKILPLEFFSRGLFSG